MPIQVLPDEVANKIAAGEVVERPASVVKELVENAVDAGATDIRVELTDGGRRMIRVIDNGSGMTAEDAALCLKRHATSKLTSADDLETIATLGFRGEAIPSIASVSLFEILTRTENALEGARVTVEGGITKEVAPAGCPVGTRISVGNLFYNVPARLKFLKAESTELGHALNHLQWAALAYPHIRFVFVHNNRTLLDVAPCETRRERIRLLYGKEFAESILSFTKTFETTTVECHLGDANLTKPNRTYQFFFLNNRPIRDKTIGAALTEAMREYIPRDRYPVAFLFLNLAPTEVDVNVHPAKAEVRFRNDRAIFRYVRLAISQGLSDAKFVPEVGAKPGANIPTPNDPNDESPLPYPLPAQRNILPVTRPTYGSPPSRSGIGAADFPSSSFRSAQDTARRMPDVPTERYEVFPRSMASVAPGSDEVELLDYEGLELIGGLFNTYILLADEEYLYFVDQHVASERVHYERVLLQMRAEKVLAQGLLLPLSVELTPMQHLRYQGSEKWLARFGFEAEEFGGETLLIRAVPALLPADRAAALFKDLLDRLGSEHAPERGWEELREKAAALIGCHAAVRAGDRLNAEAQRVLLKELSQARLPFTCPHGRPIIVRMPRTEIELRFKRR